MEFTYDNYGNLLKYLKEQGYSSHCYQEDSIKDFNVILRHDIDIDIFNCLKLAEVEEKNGFFSTWFIQLNNDCYNILSSSTRKILLKLAENHKLGLHIDPQMYGDIKSDDLCIEIKRSYDFYAQYLPLQKNFSFHRPGKMAVKMSLEVDGFVNAYESNYIDDMVYISDSNRRQFMDLPDIWSAMDKGRPIHLLTHPLWWGNSNRSLEEIYNELKYNVEKSMCYNSLKDNIRIFEYLKESD